LPGTDPQETAITDTATPARDVLLAMVLDKSGSMNSLAGATVEGVNAFLDEQKNGPGSVRLSLTLFDTDFEVRYVAEPLERVAPLGSRANRYSPQGGTALYDAVATTIMGVQAYLDNNMHWKGDVVVVIQTDGEENSSRTHTLDDVNALISTKTRAGWEFIFQGTGQAAWTEGQKFSAIPASARFAGAADGASHLAAYATSSRAMSRKRLSGERFEDSLRAEGMQDEQS
jgi:hypothetical protein